MQDIGVKASWSLAGQGGLLILVEAAQEVAVKKGDSIQDAVPSNLAFLLQEPKSSEEAYSQIVQLLEAAKIDQIEQMGFPAACHLARGAASPDGQI